MSSQYKHESIPNVIHSYAALHDGNFATGAGAYHSFFLFYVFEYIFFIYLFYFIFFLLNSM